MVEILTHELTGELYTKHFSLKELRCRCSMCKGRQPHKVKRYALEQLERARAESGESMRLTSAYRCNDHPDEASKPSPGWHNKGVAFDIYVPIGAKRTKILASLFKFGITGFGWDNEFIHVDWRGYFAGWRYN